jgi:ribosomal protein S18 acetylase RimI-like enzyme
MTGPSVGLQPLDRERFGVVAARCSATTVHNLPEVLEFCQSHSVELLVARCDAEDYAAAQAIESAGGLLTDTLVYYGRSLSKASPTLEPDATVIRTLGPGEADCVRDVAAAAFAGYRGHYHTDSRLDRAKADEAYADWAYRSCVSPAMADEVLVAEQAGAVVGFLTLRRNGPDEAEIVLNGVAPRAQRQGVYRRLLVAAIDWSRAQRASRLLISTQLTNTPVQKAWSRTGFELLRAHHTFHLWFK